MEETGITSFDSVDASVFFGFRILGPTLATEALGPTATARPGRPPSSPASVRPCAGGARRDRAASTRRSPSRTLSQPWPRGEGRGGGEASRRGAGSARPNTT